MSKTTIVSIIVAGVLVWVMIYIHLSLVPRSVTIKINCDLAEISPDIPLKAKELCRKARGRI